MKKLAGSLALVFAVLLMGIAVSFIFWPKGPDPVMDTGAATVSTTGSSGPVSAATQPSAGREGIQYADMKAMWLSQYDLSPIYLNGNTQREKQDFIARIHKVLDNVKKSGYNTVLLQVRPFGDSMYPSEFYPMSAYVTGSLATAASYDPVQILVELAHEKGLSIHAWINPLRAMAEGEILQVGEEYPIRQWYEDPQTRGKYLVAEQGRWYLNPAYEPVQDLICDGAREALTLYDFDGLHMDDYFYPLNVGAHFDSAAYGAYQAGGGTLELADFRRQTLNTLVAKLYQTTKQVDPGLPFGISPAGNVDGVYNGQFADVYTWCAEPGYIDYICPQVYFGLEHATHDFRKVCSWYQDMIRTDSVELVIGLTLAKAQAGEDQWAGSGKYEWAEHQDILARSLLATEQLERCKGIAMFCYQFYYDPATGLEVAETAQERENLLPVLLEITWKEE